ncbi:MAG TPA: hypothetical protein VKT77_13095 [Chthonomonadaceae bacterium]|nr:hypothetical protein [Chthonomonadaceae bacterium]
MNGTGLIWTGRAITWLWVGVWLWFGIASVLSGKHVWDGLAHLAIPGTLMVGAAVAVWRWPVAGGVLLVVEGAALGGLMLAGLLRPTVLLFLLLVAPPVVAGILLLVGRPSAVGAL